MKENAQCTRKGWVILHRSNDFSFTRNRQIVVCLKRVVIVSFLSRMWIYLKQNSSCWQTRQPEGNPDRQPEGNPRQTARRKPKQTARRKPRQTARRKPKQTARRKPADRQPETCTERQTERWPETDRQGDRKKPLGDRKIRMKVKEESLDFSRRKRVV